MDQQYLTDQAGRKLAVVVPLEAPVPAIADLLAELPNEDLDELKLQIVQLRAQRAVAAIHAYAEEHGLDRLTDDEIEAEISAARRDASQS